MYIYIYTYVSLNIKSIQAFTDRDLDPLELGDNSLMKILMVILILIMLMIIIVIIF